MRSTTALRADAPGDGLHPVTIERRDLRGDDVAVRVTHCGVCFTDLHHLRGTDPSAFPLVPGHEFVGEVIAVGDAVTRFELGDPVAVGNIIDSCGRCRWCREGQENWCAQVVLTYGGQDHDGEQTLGGYSGEVVVRERFTHARPPGLDPAGVAPLLCAGITVWEPLSIAGVGPGSRVGVVGIGGLGHLAVRLAAALGAEVTAFTTSTSKVADAERLGASRVVVSTDSDAMSAVADSLDIVIDTVSVDHELAPYLDTLNTEGVLFPVGYLGTLRVDSMSLLRGRKRVSSSGSGGVDRTAELLAFCGKHDIVADVEVLPARAVATALDRLARNDVRYRFVLDTTDL